MSLRRMLLVCAIGLICVCSADAQESVRLRFHIVRDNSVLATPEVTVASGSAGHIDINKVLSCVFTPTLRDSRLTVAFDIRSGDKHLQPQLEIGKNDPGAVSWRSASGELIKVTIEIE
jgi:hypothetical protein